MRVVKPHHGNHRNSVNYIIKFTKIYIKKFICVYLKQAFIACEFKENHIVNVRVIQLLINFVIPAQARLIKNPPIGGDFY